MFFKVVNYPFRPVPPTPVPQLMRTANTNRIQNWLGQRSQVRPFNWQSTPYMSGLLAGDQLQPASAPMALEGAGGPAWTPGGDIPQESPAGAAFRRLAPIFGPYGSGFIPQIYHSINQGRMQQANRDWREAAQNAPVDLPTDSGPPDPNLLYGGTEQELWNNAAGRINGLPVDIPPDTTGNNQYDFGQPTVEINPAGNVPANLPYNAGTTTHNVANLPSAPTGLRVEGTGSPFGEGYNEYGSPIGYGMTPLSAFANQAYMDALAAGFGANSPGGGDERNVGGRGMIGYLDPEGNYVQTGSLAAGAQNPGWADYRNLIANPSQYGTMPVQISPRLMAALSRGGG